MPSKPETALVKSCVQYLEQVHHAQVYRMNAGAPPVYDARGKRRWYQGQKAGTADILAHIPWAGPKSGKFKVVWIECKGARGRLRDSQRLFLMDRRADGCLVGVARSIDDVDEILKGKGRIE